jgi:hypothetical protein
VSGAVQETVAVPKQRQPFATLSSVVRKLILCTVVKDLETPSSDLYKPAAAVIGLRYTHVN